MAKESALSFVIGHFRRRGTCSRDTTIVAGRVVYSDDPSPHKASETSEPRSSAELSFATASN
jgi:hypothetical protein